MNKTIAKLDRALRDFEADRGAYFDVTDDDSWRVAHAFEALLEAVGYRHYIEEGNLLPSGDTGKRWIKYTKLKEE